MHDRIRCAPVRRHVVLAATAGILLLAMAVCALHVCNAVALKGTLDVQTLDAQPGVIMQEPWEQAGILHLEGAWIRAQVGAVHMRVGLMEEGSNTALLLNTQMVRRGDYAQAYGCDDHCGFHAAVLRDDLAQARYRVVLADESGAQARVMDTGVWLTLTQDGIHVERDAHAEGENDVQAAEE